MYSIPTRVGHLLFVNKFAPVKATASFRYNGTVYTIFIKDRLKQASKFLEVDNGYILYPADVGEAEASEMSMDVFEALIEKYPYLFCLAVKSGKKDLVMATFVGKKPTDMRKLKIRMAKFIKEHGGKPPTTRDSQVKKVYAWEDRTVMLPESAWPDIVKAFLVDDPTKYKKAYHKWTLTESLKPTEAKAFIKVILKKFDVPTGNIRVKKVALQRTKNGKGLVLGSALHTGEDVLGCGNNFSATIRLTSFQPSVVMHECAHVVQSYLFGNATEGHGPEFVGCYAAILDAFDPRIKKGKAGAVLKAGKLKIKDYEDMPKRGEVSIPSYKAFEGANCLIVDSSRNRRSKMKFDPKVRIDADGNLQ